MVGNDVAIAGIFVISVAGLDFPARVAPVRVSATPFAHVRNQPGDRTVGGDLHETDLDQMVDVARDESFGLHCRP